MNEAKQALDSLPERQRKVAIMCGSGLSDKAIAARLNLAVQTVKTNKYIAFRKLGITKNTQLAVICTLAGLVTDWREAA